MTFYDILKLKPLTNSLVFMNQPTPQEIIAYRVVMRILDQRNGQPARDYTDEEVIKALNAPYPNKNGTPLNDLRSLKQLLTSEDLRDN